MKWIITKDNRVVCETTVEYPKEIIKAMKEAGYKIKKVEEDEENEKSCTV